MAPTRSKSSKGPEPLIPVGFNYAKALLAIRKEMTYVQIAEFCGYESKQAVGKIIRGAIPSHVHGEAIYVLHCELFGKKPPMTKEQAAGTLPPDTQMKDNTELVATLASLISAAREK